MGLTVASLAHGEAVPYAASLSTDAELRAGPSTNEGFYATNRLRVGDHVQVLKERPDGWLEVRPPIGSFSWIEAHDLQQIAKGVENYVVKAARVEVLVGSELVESKPHIVGATLTQSAQVRRYQKGGRYGELRTEAGKIWMPIEPPDAEVRYLRSEAIARQQVTAAAAPIAPPTSLLPAPAPVPAPLQSSFVPTPGAPVAESAAVTHAQIDEIYKQAVLAERAGRAEEAVRLYTQVAALGLPMNHESVSQALRRADALRNGTEQTASNNFSRIAPLQAAEVAPSARLATPTSPLPPASGTFTTARQPDAVPAAPQQPQWIGRLRVAGRGINDRPTFVLEPARGSMMYVQAANGVDLQSHVGQNVELLGNVVYYGPLRANYMMATQIRQVP